MGTRVSDILSKLAADAPVKKRELLVKIAQGQTPAVAAKSLGLSLSEIREMVADDPEFQAHMAACRAAFLGEQEAKVAASPDWKAAVEILKRAEETKTDWANPEAGDHRIVIELNIERGKKDD